MTDINNLANQVVMQVEETQDLFVFSTLSKYALNNFDIVIEKKELAMAIQLIRMSEEYGPKIDERWNTATQQAAALDDAYRRGFHDGIAKEHNRIIDILEGEKDD